MEKYTNVKNMITYILIIIAGVIVILGSFIMSSKYLVKKIKQIEKEDRIGEVKIVTPKREIIIEKIKNILPVWNENAQENIKSIYFSDEKVAYLTFDDGPSEITNNVLQILKEEQVPATFFVLGSRVDLNPDILKKVYYEGHYIANHGYTHKYSQIYESQESILNEYLKCEQAIKNAIDNQEYNSFLFRYPGGSSGGKYEKIKSQAKSLLSQNNIAFTNWNCLTGDAEGSNTYEAIIDKFNITRRKQDGLIVLMHDAGDKQLTADTLKEVIQILKKENYKFKNFYEIFK